MLIIGAKGFAKEVLEIFDQKNELGGLAFFDDVNTDIGDLLYEKFPILKNEKQVLKHFKIYSKEFVIGIGNPKLRKKLYTKFVNLGGIFKSVISSNSEIGSFGTRISNGCNIMSNTVITNDVKIGKGVIINLSCTVGHDSIIEDFVELCPSVNVSGNCKIKENVFIGTDATILPNITIGQNSIIAAGALVTKDVPPNVMVAGVPAKMIKRSFKWKT